jgi:hypothetical protein
LVPLKVDKNPTEFVSEVAEALGLYHNTLNFEEKVSKLKEKNLGDSQNLQQAAD